MPRRPSRSPTSPPSWPCSRTWWPGRSSATRPWRRNWPCASTRCQRFASGTLIFILGFAKKILLANPCGHVADAVFNAANPLAARRLGGGAGLCFPDLLRLLRLLGHGGGAGADARVRVPEEFRRALPGREHHRVVAPLAHLAFQRAAGLPLLPARRQPQWAQRAPTSTCRWSCCWADYGTAPNGTSSCGAPIMGCCWPANGGAASRAFTKASARPFRIGLTFLLMLFSWVLFRADNLTAAWHYFGAMFGLDACARTPRPCSGPPSTRLTGC